MTYFNLKYTVGFCCLIMFGMQAMSANAGNSKGPNEHARKWNQFADDVLALHQKLVEKIPTTKKTLIGGYPGNPDYYKEETYTSKKTGKVISIVQWENKNPKNMHTIQVNVYNDQGIIVRDYTAAYLPDYRNAPTQTLISVHNYNGELHAFRTYDATGDRIGEQCRGKLNKQNVFIVLDEDEIAAAEGGDSKVMEQADYKACFKGLSVKVGKFLKPQ